MKDPPRSSARWMMANFDRPLFFSHHDTAQDILRGPNKMRASSAL
jgi:hypothetical protein